MEQIKELGNILQKEAPDLFENLTESDSKKSMLFRAVMENLVRTDNEASMLIYGKIDQGKKYQMLKRNLKEHLIDLLNNINHKTQVNLLLVESELREKIGLATKILSNNVYHYAEKLINQVYKKAETYFLFNVMAECADLYIQINSIKGFPGKAEKWLSRTDQLNQLSGIQQKARSYLQIAESYFIHYCSLSNKVAKKIKEQINTIEKCNNDITSPFLEHYIHLLKIYYHYHSFNLEKILPEIESIHLLTNKHPFLSDITTDFDLLLHEAKVEMGFGNLDMAEKILSRSLEISDYKSFLKFKSQALLFNLCLRKNQLFKAYTIIKEVADTYEFGLFLPEAKAAWIIRRAYLSFLLKSEKNLRHELKPETEISLHKMDLECKKLSKDKQGYHAQYLIIRQLLAWSGSNTEGYYGGKNLQLYYYRNLKNLKELRVKFFFKCLSNIAINEFSRDAILDQKRTFQQNLREANYPLRYDINEVVPFETIFDILLDNYRG